MTGAIFVAPYTAKQFVQRYVETYGDDIQASYAANSYEYAMLTARLFGGQDQGITPDQVLDRYKSVTTEQGEATRYKLNVSSSEGSGFDFKVVLRRVEADGIVDVE